MTAIAEFNHQGLKASIASRTKTQQNRMNQVVALHLAGLNLSEIARSLGVSRRTVYRDLEQTEDARVNVTSILEDAGVDAHDAHLQLSRIFDGDRSEIQDEAGDIKPVKEWPLVFRQCLNFVIEDVSQRSHDGATKDKDGGWDKSGKRIKILGIDPQYLKTVELLMKHKAVDAMAKTEGDTNINITVTAQEQRIARAKQRIARAIPAGKIIEIEAKSEVSTTTGSGLPNLNYVETGETALKPEDSTTGT